jgi:ABC-type transport system involved in cytochrome bd biosynthesis fused ATPase/permease subunit
MYRFIVFLHVASVLAFMLAHGGSAAVAFRLKKVSELHEVRTLLTLSSSTLSIFYASFLVLLGSGIAAAFMGHHWDEAWLWVALGLFVLITVSMLTMASPHFSALRKACGMEYFARKTMPAEEPRPEEVAILLRSSVPVTTSLIGTIGIFIILWLMIYKPF